MVYIEQEVDLSTKIGGDGNIRLSFCVYNASGPRSGTAEALHKVAASASGAVLTKSATLLAQDGNPHPRTYHIPTADHHIASFNSEGLPNNGIDYYIDDNTIQKTMTIEKTDGTIEVISKPYIVSLSGKTLDDNIEMLKRIQKSTTKSKISSIELNLACPNIIGKPIIGYDFEQMEMIFQRLSNEIYNNNSMMPALGIKLPPYFDFQHFQTVCTIINKYKSMIKYVVSINTIGNSLCIDYVSEIPYISSNNGFAGMSGHAVKYTGLANVRKLRELLHPTIDIIGVGGISTGQDVFEMLLVGANACQVGTQHWTEGPICFDRIQQELYDIMKSKGYYSVSDIINKLKPWNKESAEKSRQIRKQQQHNSSKSPTKKVSHDALLAIKNEAHYYKMISMALVVLLAILSADKFGLLSGEKDTLLPQE